MRQNGLEAAVKKLASGRKTVVFGICGGYQMLGRTLKDPYGSEGGGEMEGMSLLPIDTVFEREKTRTQTSGRIEGLSGPRLGLNGMTYTGYEIHMGVSGGGQPVIGSGNVYGTYVHGIFDDGGIAGEIAAALCRQKGLDAEKILGENKAFDPVAYKETQYNKLADEVRRSLDMDLIYRIIKEGIN